MASNTVPSTEKYAVVGTRPLRHDGTDKVTGRARYGADVRPPGLLHGKILRSPHPHARIKAIDATRALALPGVKAVVTSAEFTQPAGRLVDLGEGVMTNSRFLSNNCLAAEKVLYKGHAVAAVAAVSPHVAEQALSLIDVDYEVLPFVIDVLDAMKDDAPVLHERLANVSDPTVWAGGLRSEEDRGRSTNVANRFVFEVGDVDQGFGEATVVVEREYRTQSVHQGYIEPPAATAHWSADGNLTIWSSSQGQFNVRDQTSTLLDIPVSNIKVIPMEVGGAFGGKTVVYVEPVAALLSRKTGRPVKVSMGRAEVFEGTGPTAGSFIRVKIGANGQGRITAADATLIYEAGAFPGSLINPGCQCLLGSYDISNVRIEGYDVVLNKPKTGAYRAPGAPAAAFAAETVIDEICEKLGMDPLEFRLINGAREGTRRITGPRFPRIGYLETVEAAKQHEHYNAPLEGPNRGRGVAGAFWFNGTGPSSAIVSVNSDGTVSLVEGSPDLAGSRVAMAQHVAEALGIAVESVRPAVGDTDSVGYTAMSGGSSVTFKTGWASYEAAQDVRRQMVERAAKIWDVSTDDVEYAGGVISHRSDSELRFTFKELAGRLNPTGGPIVGRGNLNPRGVGAAFGVHIVDVEVDPDTGKVQVLRYTALQDVGKAIHPGYAEGQLQGGAVQGIGWALHEEYFFNEQGHMANSSFLDYRMPTSLDLPMIDTVLVEVANPGHPYGVRGVGEVPIVPPPAALANAIYRATGVRMARLPMAPGNILEALWDKK